MRKEMLKEAAEEMARLQDYAHLKTDECFKSVFGENVLSKVKEHDEYKVPLLFVNEEQN